MLYSEAMAKVSAGLLLYRHRDGVVEVLLVHPGGPFWRNKDEGAWTFPRGEVEAGEDLDTAARREFQEETGHAATGPLIPLGCVRQKSGKVVHAWAVEGDLDTTTFQSNMFNLEWPPRSGKQVEFPEIDRAGFFSPPQARTKIRQNEAPFLDKLEERLGEANNSKSEPRP